MLIYCVIEIYTKKDLSLPRMKICSALSIVLYLSHWCTVKSQDKGVYWSLQVNTSCAVSLIKLNSFTSQNIW